MPHPNPQLPLHTGAYSLPLLWFLTYQPSPCSWTPSRPTPHDPSTTAIRGTLCYPNGTPVSLYPYRLLAVDMQGLLPEGVTICAQGYYLRYSGSFVTETLYPSPIPPTHAQTTPYHHDHDLPIIMSTICQRTLQYLLSIGLLSPREKSINKLAIVTLRNRLHRRLLEIMDSHAGSPGAGEVRYGSVASGVMKQEQKQGGFKNGSSSDNASTICESMRERDTKQDLTTTHAHNNHRQAMKQCCRLEHQKQPQKYSDEHQQGNRPIKIISNLQIVGQSGESQMNGGNFVVRKYEAVVDGVREQLAVKGIKEGLTVHQRDSYVRKMEHEWGIIGRIRDSRYICTYYQLQQSLQHQETLHLQEQPTLKPQSLNHRLSPALPTPHLLMPSLPLTLKSQLCRPVPLPLLQTLHSLLCAADSLHQCGLVHRDLKPGNIMFTADNRLQLIDFSQSIEAGTPLPSCSLNLGYTLPYSPPQCMTICQEGYSSMKIDNWSLGMTMLEVVQGELPVGCCRSVMGNVRQAWMSGEFHWCVGMRGAGVVGALGFGLRVLALGMCRLRQEERLCLGAAREWLEESVGVMGLSQGGEGK